MSDHKPHITDAAIVDQVESAARSCSERPHPISRARTAATRSAALWLLDHNECVDSIRYRAPATPDEELWRDPDDVCAHPETTLAVAPDGRTARMRIPLKAGWRAITEADAIALGQR